MDNNKLEQLRSVAVKEIAAVSTPKELEAFHVKYLGRKRGLLTEIIKKIPQLSPIQKKEIGQFSNAIKTELNALIEQKKVMSGSFDSVASGEFFDVSAPGEKPHFGTLHPITQVLQSAEEIFQKMGFDILEPRELDDDWHVFTAVNIPPQHPARDMWDTFWTNEGFIPITHTSSMQNRALLQHAPPVRVVIPGRCFRHEATDARHEHTFYQIEGLYVDKHITLSHLIGTLKTFLESYFQKELNYKIQPTYFPFVEPGLEFLISCVICGGSGEKDDKPCPTCGHSGWLELVPCGPVHPYVLKMGGLDPNIYSGFAWGLGLDRLAMLKYGIEDVRLFHSGDLKFLRQF